ncbi:protein tyrosine phosphatase [Scheffersomyces xylosifermentans]|uniref:protein tyrosine phosphatase n=1 Tax=Scheffersomyces xylosifermentans TaxID=1304137 RepID=UPI00315DCC7E
MSSSPSICASPNFTFPQTPSQAGESSTTTACDYFNPTNGSTPSKFTSRGDYFKIKTSFSPPANQYGNSIANNNGNINNINISTSSNGISSSSIPNSTSTKPIISLNDPSIHAPGSTISLGSFKFTNEPVHNHSENPTTSRIPTTITHTKPPQHINTTLPASTTCNQHKSINDSISSISSNTSDLTIYDSSKRINDSIETLVDEDTADTRRLPKHKHNSSLTVYPTLLSFNELDETQAPKASSAIEPSFNTSRLPSIPVPVPVPVPSFNIPPSQKLKKQITLPSLSLNGSDLSFDSVKSEQQRRLSYLPSQNYKQQIEKLNEARIEYFSVEDISIPFNDEHVLVIDIRPFTDFAKGHVKNALNICLPSTLLKRPNFTLLRCINSLPNYEKLRFNQFLASDDFEGVIVLYDSAPNSSNLYHMCNKFINCSSFMQSKHSIHLIDSTISQFAIRKPDLFEVGSSSSMSPSRENDSLNNYLPPIIVTEKYRSHSVAELSPYQRSTPSSSSSFDKTSTPILSNFTLPKQNVNMFKLRHNEELAVPSSIAESSSNSAVSEILSKNAINLFKLKNLPADRSQLPQWMKSKVLDSVTNEQSTKINDDFYALEKDEQKRLISALSLQKSTANVLSPLADNEVAPTISCGFEFGHKNRYKDIFLYEHSRVRLNDNAEEREDNHLMVQQQIPEDYINASYINPIDTLDSLATVSPDLLKHLKYIATQGPLEETMGDFWKVLINLRIPLIISLTDEIENGVMKCSPFWKSGVYKSNKDTIKLKLDNEQKLHDYLIIRAFSMTMSSDVKVINHKVLQIQLLSWPDMGTVSTPVEIIQLVMLKHYILSRLDISNCSYPTIIHCSAGCGRTGTLCTVDTVINILKNIKKKELEFDPIYSIVNNFRKQRISMVQNLRQYFLIYEVLLHYLNDGKVDNAPTTKSSWNDLIYLDIVHEFIDSYAELKKTNSKN